jgi:hypothetical protein
MAKDTGNLNVGSSVGAGNPVSLETGPKIARSQAERCRSEPDAVSQQRQPDRLAHHSVVPTLRKAEGDFERLRLHARGSAPLIVERDS